MSESAHSNNRNITLTLSQEEAVSCNDRYIAVIAGPGSGKTRVLTERVVRLIEEGHIPSESILALSFSAKAANEVRKRLKERLGYNDRLPFRNLLIKLYNRIQLSIFHISSNEDVVIGEDGWLFYNGVYDGNPIGHYTGEIQFSEQELERIADNLIATRDELREQGTEFVVFIAPNKERIYAEYMPSYFGEPAEKYPVMQLIQYLKEHTDIRVVYPYEELMAYKQSNPQQLLYFKTDTHWNELGGYIGTRALLKELGTEIQRPDEVTLVQYERNGGDLAGMLNLQEAFASEKGYSISGYNGYQIAVEENALPGEENYVAVGAPEKKVFVIRDSFYGSMAAYLAPQFAYSRASHVDLFSTDMIESWNPDIVVFEIVERYVKRLNIPIMDKGKKVE